MDFTIKKDDFLKCLNNLIGAVTRKSSIIYFSHIRVSVSDGNIELATTDADISIIERIPLDGITECGSLAIDALKLFEIIKRLPADSEIAVKSDQRSLNIQCSNVRFSLPFLDAEHFPIISEEDERFSIELSGDDIKSLLDKIKFAVCLESTRISMKGILINGENNKIISVATDGHRISSATIEKNIKDDFSFILPRKTVIEVIKIFSKCDVFNVHLYGSQGITRIKFMSGGVSLITKLIAGTFPEFQRVFSEKFANSFIIGKRELIGAIERVAIVSSERSKSIKFTFEDGAVNLMATNADSSFAKEIIKFDHKLERCSVHFNYTYLLDVLSVIDGDKVEVFLNNPDSAVAFKCSSDLKLTHVIMPMSIHE